MELTLHKPGNHNFVRSFTKESITVNDTSYRNSIVVSADELITDWPASSMNDLTRDRLEPILCMNPEIVLLGTGLNQAFLSPELMMAFYSRGIGVEAMTTEAACRTFNVLLSEDRNVAAALIFTSS